ncbi:MAG: DHH family phosphoesterase [Pseudomonadota bacterium]
MSSQTLLSIRDTILGLFSRVERVLIVVSRPVDPDCIGTGLSLQWFLEQQSKKPDVVCFFRMPENLAGFPDVSRVHTAAPEKFDFSPYHLVILIDGSSWGQFFGDAWQELLEKIDATALINIDHHISDEIQTAIPERCLNVKASSTAQVLYEYLIEPSGMQMPAMVAEYLYLALLYDTRGFRNEMHAGMYRFAEILLASGADHLRAVDVNYDMRAIRFFEWAIAHTELHPELELTMLCIDGPLHHELTRAFGDTWMDFDAVYKEVFERQVQGFHYGIILTDNLDGTVRFSWRTRNYGRHHSMADRARNAGFRAGGHRNAGGGSFTGSIEEAKTKLLAEMRKALHGNTL